MSWPLTRAISSRSRDSFKTIDRKKLQGSHEHPETLERQRQLAMILFLAGAERDEAKNAIAFADRQQTVVVEVAPSGANWCPICASVPALSQKTCDRNLTRSPVHSKAYLISNPSTTHDFEVHQQLIQQTARFPLPRLRGVQTSAQCGREQSTHAILAEWITFEACCWTGLIFTGIPGRVCCANNMVPPHRWIIRMH